MCQTEVLVDWFTTKILQQHMTKHNLL